MLGEWEYGFFSLTPVGATNVGSIVVNFDKEFVTNQQPLQKGVMKEKTYEKPFESTKGEEIAFFHMGSTVVLIFQSPGFEFSVKSGDKLKLGQELGVITKSAHMKMPQLNEVVPSKVKIDNVPVSES